MPLSGKAAERARKVLENRRTKQIQEEAQRQVNQIFRCLDVLFGADCTDEIIASQVQHHLIHGYNTSELGLPPRRCTAEETAELCLIDLVGAVCATECTGFACYLVFASQEQFFKVQNTLRTLLLQVKESLLPQLIYEEVKTSLVEYQFGVSLDGDLRLIILNLVWPAHILSNVPIPTARP